MKGKIIAINKKLKSQFELDIMREKENKLALVTHMGIKDKHLVRLFVTPN